MEGFILTRHWRDTSSGVSLELWLSSDAGPVRLIVPSQSSLFFIRQSALNTLQDITASFPALASITTKALDLKNVYGEPVLGVYCKQQRQLRDICEQLRLHDIDCWESDIRPPERFLMERFITGSLQVDPLATYRFPVSRQKNYTSVSTQKVKTIDYQPSLRVVSIDIETSMDAKALYSIAVYGDGLGLVFMVSEHEVAPYATDDISIVWCAHARDCLQRFLQWLDEYDPDILIGWHVIQFDCWVLTRLCERWNVPFSLGRAKQTPHWRTDSRDVDDGDEEGSSHGAIFDRKRRYLQVPGRVVLDGIELLRTAFYHFDSFSLQSVATALLGESKLLTHDDRGQAITDLFFSDNIHDKIALAEYNLQDCKLVWDIFEKTNLLDFAIARSRLTGMPLDKMGGSVASFDYAYLPKLHRHGYVAPNLGELPSDVVSPGGYVMDSLPGLYRHVLVLDFKSLYPSIIRTFTIDPYAFWFADHQQLAKDDIVQGFNGAFFARKQHILPDIIRDLWQERDKAKAENDQPLSQAIKIIMNSFYGVLGSTGCRFFDPRVCSSITLRGHEIIQLSHEWIQQQGYEVIYGDTDSLFVWLGKDFEQQANTNKEAAAIGHGLAEGLNVWWRERLNKQSITSALEIEFETHYQDFLMPTIRGSEKGSKKRYAGTVVCDDVENDKNIKLIFKGLETVRADWTPLAKDFQRTLYGLIFDKAQYQHYIKTVVADVLAGRRHQDLVYSKRLRRRVSGYEKSNPPHIKAAKKLESNSQQLLARGDLVQYVITLNGPEPVDYLQSPIDYQHYIDKQLKPIADSILSFLDDSFERLIDKQMTLL